jgi:hypothetical protein
MPSRPYRTSRKSPGLIKINPLLGLTAAGTAILLCTLGTSSVLAQQPPARPAVLPDTGEFGRLFFTPQQRQELDRRRQLNIQEVTVTNVDLVTVNGQIARSSGKSTTWINGVAQDDTYRGRDPSSVTLGENTDSTITIRVGQTIDKTRGAVTDGLIGGEIRKRSASPDKKAGKDKQ